MSHHEVEVYGVDDVELDEMDYGNFDLDTYALRKEREVSAGLKGDTSYRAPVSSSWLFWRIRLPNILSLVTVAVLAAYEILVLVSMFVLDVRRAMVDGGLMWALSALIVLLCALLAAVVVITMNDWNIGMLTSKLSRTKPESAD